MKWGLLALALSAGSASAQIVSPLGTPSIDTSALASKDDVQAAIVAATPTTCPVPKSDTLVGSAGVSDRCMPRADATRPTVIQAKNTITDATGNWSITFDAPYATPPVYVDARVYGATQPYLCTVSTLTLTGAGGKCYQLVATTLPSVLTSVLGLVVSPVTSAASGLSVRVVARQ